MDRGTVWRPRASTSREINSAELPRTERRGRASKPQRDRCRKNEIRPRPYQRAAEAATRNRHRSAPLRSMAWDRHFPRGVPPHSRLTLDKAISRWDRDQVFGCTPIKFSQCGSREIIRGIQAKSVVKTNPGSPFDRLSNDEGSPLR